MATKKVNGKNKGNTFERKIANALSDRFAEYLGLTSGFRRNSDSGSYFGGANVKRAQNHDLDNACFGDIMCPKNFIFSIECKNYKTAPSFQSIINKSVPQWDGWIKQASQDAITSNKSPLLIIKYNNVPEFVLINTNIDTLDTIFTYAGYYAYKLESFLTLENTIFFE